METSVASAAEVGRCLRGATGLLPNNGHSQRLPCLPSCVGRPAPPLSCKSPPFSFESLQRTAFREKQRSSRAPQQRLGLAIAVVVFALRQCNEAPSQPGGFPFNSGEGHPPSPPQVIGAASRTTPTLSISLASGSPILKFGSRLDGCGSGGRGALRHTAAKRRRALLLRRRLARCNGNRHCSSSAAALVTRVRPRAPRPLKSGIGTLPLHAALADAQGNLTMPGAPSS
ncbi:hypothetical protein ERJ75_001072700 [Trypanosoma vivax]|nr:hypothetical protein ERJ75_001072700 [Trypanosoma vivax]